jgi:predicted Zn-dependent protease
MKGAQVAKKVADLNISDEQEHEIGAQVSQNIRQRYGVVQDAAVHKYVTLVGAALAVSSTRPNIDWQFIVLDTDGVNAFAAPGGFVHITRGALGLLKNERSWPACWAQHRSTRSARSKKSKAKDLGTDLAGGRADEGGVVGSQSRNRGGADGVRAR